MHHLSSVSHVKLSRLIYHSLLSQTIEINQDLNFSYHILSLCNLLATLQRVVLLKLSSEHVLLLIYFIHLSAIDFKDKKCEHGLQSIHLCPTPAYFLSLVWLFSLSYSVFRPLQPSLTILLLCCFFAYHRSSLLASPCAWNNF